MKRLRGAVWFLALAVMPLVSRAAASCTVSAVGPAFGAYSPANTNPTLANGSVTATCTWTGGGPTNVNLVASYSAGNSGSYPNRWMLSGTNRLNYNIYFESNFQTIRGNGSNGTQTGSASLRVSNGTRTATATGVIYGRIPAQQDAVPGNYADLITITMTY